MNRSTRIRVSALAAVAGPAAIVIIAGCVHKEPAAVPAKRTAAASAPLEGPFVGNEACRECHAAEFASHAASAHAATLHRVGAPGAAAKDPPLGKIASTDMTVGRRGERIVMTLDGEPGYALPLTFALGSGKTGITYISVLDDDRIIEVRKSYFPRSRAWYTTPGHREDTPKTVGTVYSREMAAQCILCHAVKAALRVDTLDSRLFGVGCESCHGPGDLHVAAMRSGERGDIHMPRLSTLPPKELNVMCGRCHRNVSDVAGPGMQGSAVHATDGKSDTHRFQPFGIMTSRCYLKSGGKLSCLACHDPHADASRDMARYESACLSCHGGPSGGIHAPAGGKKCPVNPTGGCIPCHMPFRPLFKNGTPPVQMADHRIAIHRTGPGAVTPASLK
jgi:hypothetical protein